MRKYIANSNYNITIYAETLKKAKKMYKEAIINSFLLHKQMIEETELIEMPLYDENFNYTKVLEYEYLFYLTKDNNICVNNHLYKLAFSGEYLIQMQKTQIKTCNAQDLFRHLNDPFFYININKFYRLIQNVKYIK